MRFIGLLVIVWLIAGAVAAASAGISPTRRKTVPAPARSR